MAELDCFRLRTTFGATLCNGQYIAAVRWAFSPLRSPEYPDSAWRSYGSTDAENVMALGGLPHRREAGNEWQKLGPEPLAVSHSYLPPATLHTFMVPFRSRRLGFLYESFIVNRVTYENGAD